MAIALGDILDQRQVALHLKSRRRPNAVREVVSLFEKTGSVARPEDFLAQVRFNRLAAIVTLYQALGGGWILDTEPRRP